MKRDRMPKTLADAPLLTRADDHRTDLTDAERMTRMCDAVHEAAHLVVACRLRVYPFDAFVRIPGKTPKCGGHAGSYGSVGVVGNLAQEAAIAAAGIIANSCLPNFDQRPCTGDSALLDTWADDASTPGEAKAMLPNAVTAMVDREWDVIEAVAACLLHCADATGYLKASLTNALTLLVRCTPAYSFRSSVFARPSLYNRGAPESPPTIYAVSEHPYVRFSAPLNFRSKLLPTA